ncbi:MAG TPA: tetratricopeptide repeat protein [Desulfuromonadales bacterium]|nr:tetratricopeptide repeat protein [Desulfuromonadales bacterium]
MPRFFCQFCVLITLLCGYLQSAHAVQWLALNGTVRYKVAYDEHSIRLTPLGRLELWLRFIPRGETERTLAAAEYKDKRYRSHLEFYEIDCSEQAAMLNLIDILGTSRTRLKRLQVGSPLEQILPGSLLDNAAQRICPVLDEDAESAGESEPDSVTADVLPPSSEQLQQIEHLKKITETKEATLATWKELGNIYFDTNQPELAIKAYDRALALQPDDTDILNDQGAMYRQTGDFNKALANFERASRADPNNLESLYNSGYVYAFDLNNIPKALVIWRRYLVLESKSETARQVKSFIDLYGKQLE